MIQLFSNEFKVKESFLEDFKHFIKWIGLHYVYDDNKQTYSIHGTCGGYQTLYSIFLCHYEFNFNEKNIDVYTEDNNKKAHISFTWFLSQLVDSLTIYYEFDTETQSIIATRVNDNYYEERDLAVLMDMYEN